MPSISLCRMACIFVFGIAFSCFSVLGTSSLFAQQFSIASLGFDDHEHSRADGTQQTSILAYLSDSGHAAGTSSRFFGSESYFGESAWYYNGSQLINISLMDPSHISANGSRTSIVTGMNENHQITGYSFRYSASDVFLGRTAWRYESGVHTQIGLLDSNHTGLDGYQSSQSRFINQAGQVTGVSERRSSTGQDQGLSAWIFDGQQTLNIGMNDIEHTRSDGFQNSAAIRNFNQAGQVLGSAVRFNGSNVDMGRTTWLYNGSTTLNIGLVDSEHTRTDGFRSSLTASFNRSLNENGEAIGYSTRFSGNTNIGRSAWKFDGNQTQRIGLVDAEHTSFNGVQFSESKILNANGWVIGSSERYEGFADSKGRSAWVFDGNSTIRLGLTGGSFVSNDGSMISDATFINIQGKVIGQSAHYSGSLVQGSSAWIYDDGAVYEIGPTGSRYTNASGFKDSSVGLIADDGFVTGTSQIYNNGVFAGDDAWLFDSELGQTFVFTLSTRPSDGFAYSRIEHLGENGLVLGTFTEFDPLGNDLGDRLFYFTPETGAQALGDLVINGLAANGWDSIFATLDVNSQGQIIGWGRLESQSRGQLGFLMSPIGIPEPNILWMIGAVTMAILRRRSRVDD